MKSRFIKKLVCLLIVGVFYVFPADTVPAVEKVFPFRPGEKLVYELHWGAIPAGYAELNVMPHENIDGVESWHFQLLVETNKFVDLFYKVRDRIESFTDSKVRKSLLYKKEQREGRTSRDVTVKFDHKNLVAVYSDKGDSRPPVIIENGTIDPLASIYYIRSQPLIENTEIVCPITDGKKNVLGSAMVLKREFITVNGVEYDTFLVEPDLKGVRGVFEKSEKSSIKLWITADDRRLLVKLKSKVLVGSFTGTLVKGHGS